MSQCHNVQDLKTFQKWSIAAGSPGTLSETRWSAMGTVHWSDSIREVQFQKNVACDLDI